MKQTVRVGRLRLISILASVLMLSVSLWLFGQAEQLLVGYMVLTADTQSRIPVGTALFSYVNPQGVLVCQAAVQATEPIRSGRIFVDEAGTQTGVVLVNSTAVSATVLLVLRDSAGAEISQDTLVIGPNEHRPRYIAELFPKRPANMLGSLTFDSNQPLAALTLRESRNAQGDPLYATLPVADLGAAATATRMIFPHLAAGQGYTTQLVLINPTSQTLRGLVSLYASDGTPLVLRLNGSGVSEFQYQIAPNGTYRPELDLATGLGVGYAVVTPDPGNTTPVGTVIFRYAESGYPITEAAVAATTPTVRARIFVDNYNTRTGVAIANAGSQVAEITFTLLGSTGVVERPATSRTLLAGNQMSIFAHELFPNLYDGFSGLMEISSTQPVVPLTLKLTDNSRHQPILTTLPVADLTRPTTSAQVFFPHLAMGLGFSTRLIFLNSDLTAPANGRMNFYATTGASLVVPLGGGTGSQFSHATAPGGGRQYYPGNTARVSRIALMDTVSNEETSELVINENYTVRPRLRVVDTFGAVRDDFDVSLSSLSQDVATVNNTSGSVEGRRMGFSTLTLSAGGHVTTTTVTVVGVNSGVTGYGNGIVQDQAQQLYLASTDDHTIRFASTLKQQANVYAGTVTRPGLLNDLRAQSLFKGPTFLAYDNYEGSLYVSDSSNHVIRRIRSGASGRVETFAGLGGSSGSTDGPVAQASFNNPQGMVFDRKGNLWIVDSGNHTIRRINMVTLRVELIAGSAGIPGNADGAGAAARFNSPQGIAIETETEAQRILRVQRGEPASPDRFIIADTGNHRLRRVNESGQVETLGAVASGIAAFPDDSKERTGSLVTTTVPFRFSSPSGVVVDSTGTIFVTEPGSGQVRAVLQTGSVVSAAQTLTFEHPGGLALTSGGRLLVVDSKRPIREIQYGGPEIISVSPVRVGNRGGERITIRGKNFAPDAVVVIGGVLLQSAVPTDTEAISFVAPPLPSGITTLSVRTRAGLAQKPLLIDAVPVSELAGGEITTAVGGSTFAGDGALAIMAQVGFPNAVAVDIGGNVFITDTDNHRIRKVDATSGVITTVAGTGRSGFTPDGVLAIASALSSPSGVAIDGANNIYIADSENNRIRKVVAANGNMVTVAGTGVAGSGGDRGPATSATLDTPKGVTVDTLGNVYIADTGNNRIRRIDARTGVITTVAGNGVFGSAADGSQATLSPLADPSAVAVDSSGNIFIADTYNDRIRKVTAATGAISTAAGNGQYTFAGDGGLATAASLADPSGIALDSNGNLYIADKTNNRVRKVDAATLRISTIAGTSQASFSGDLGPATAAALFRPAGVAVDASGVVLIADTFNQRVRRIAPSATSTRIITTLAGDGRTRFGGDGSPANTATINSPRGVAIDDLGNIFFADSGNNRIRQIAAGSSVITTVAGNGQVDTGSRTTSSVTGDGGPAINATLRTPLGVAIRRTNTGYSLYIADTDNQRVRKVDSPFGSTSIITTVAGNGLPGSSGDGGLATSATLDSPVAVTADAQGNVFIADWNNNRIRRVAAATGMITNFAGNGQPGYSGDGGPATSAALNGPLALALDGAGNLYIADYWNNRVRRVNASNGTIVTVAGNGTWGYSGDNGPATAASVRSPFGITLDAAGNLYIADTDNDRIRKVSNGTISTVAGNGRYEFSGDNAQATTAGLAGPVAIAIDPRGNIYISDASNDRIRAVRATGAPAPVPRTCLPLSPGQQVSGTLTITSQFSRNEPNSRADCFTFTRNAGDRITLAMNSTDFDTRLFLTNSTGQVIASDDDGGGGTDSRIPEIGTFILPTSGTYTVEATGYGASDIGRYTLLLSIASIPPTRTCPLLSFGTTFRGTLAASDLPARNREGTNSDCYTFSGNAGDRIAVTLASTAFDAYAYLMNAAGTVLASDDDSGGDGNARIPASGYFTLPASGTYTIEATSFWVAETGSYDVGVTRQGTAATAACLGINFGQIVTGSLSTSDARSRVRTSSYADCYTFSGTAGDLITMTLSSTAFDTFLILINSAGQIVSSDDDSLGGTNSRIPSSGSYTLPATGTYTIEATSYEDDVEGSYSITVIRATTAPPGSTCGTITYGQSLTGQLSTTDSKSGARAGTYTDCYRFSGTAGDNVIITLASAAFDTYLTLINSSRQVLVENDDSTGGTNSRIPSSGSYTLPATGTYTVEATSYDIDSVGSYSLSLTRVTTAPPPTCSSIPYGQTLTGQLATTDSRSAVRSGTYADCFQFSGTAGDNVVLTLSSTAFDAYLTLMNSSRLVLAENDDSTGGTNSRIPLSGSYTLPSTGTYIIEATSYDTDEVGSYSLSLTRVTGVPPPTCTPLSYGQSFAGQLATADARSAVRPGGYADCYQFSGAAGDKVVIDLSSTTFDTYLFLMNSSRQVLVENDDSASGDSRVPRFGSYTLPSAGTYIIEVTSYGADTTGNYLLLLASSTLPACTAISFNNQTITGSLATTDLVTNGVYADCFTFSGAAGDRVALTLSASAFDAYLELWDPTGSLVDSDDDSGGGTNARIPASGFVTLPVAGTYTIVGMSFYSGQTGNYALQLSR